LKYWGDIRDNVPQSKYWGDVSPLSRRDRRPWAVLAGVWLRAEATEISAVLRALRVGKDSTLSTLVCRRYQRRRRSRQ